MPMIETQVEQLTIYVQVSKNDHSAEVNIARFGRKDNGGKTLNKIKPKPMIKMVTGKPKPGYF